MALWNYKMLFWCIATYIVTVESLILELHRFLVSVSVFGQYQQILMISELVKYVIKVPILLFVHY